MRSIFLFDDNCPGPCWYSEIDIEIGRWGNANDYNSAQFVLQPFTTSGNLVRFSTAAATSFDGFNGPQGSGACTDAGQTSFNGQPVNRITCAMQWFAGVLRWFCWDELWTLTALASGQSDARLLASHELTSAQVQGPPGGIPVPGTERVHLNLWQANEGAPQFGRRVHVIVAGFEFSPQFYDFTGMGYPLGRLLLSSGTLVENLRVKTQQSVGHRRLLTEAYSYNSAFDKLQPGELDALVNIIMRQSALVNGTSQEWDMARLESWLRTMPLLGDATLGEVDNSDVDFNADGRQMLSYSSGSGFVPKVEDVALPQGSASGEHAWQLHRIHIAGLLGAGIAIGAALMALAAAFTQKRVLRRQKIVSQRSPPLSSGRKQTGSSKPDAFKVPGHQKPMLMQPARGSDILPAAITSPS